MKRLFQTIAVIVGIWLLSSFLGVMFDPARANLWTQSLMWALLSCVVLAPVILFVGTSNESGGTYSSENKSQSMEIEDDVDVGEEEIKEKGEWPYTSE